MAAQLSQGASVVRRSTGRVARFAADLPQDLADAFWTRPKELIAGGRILQARGARRTVWIEWGGQRYVLKHYVEQSWRHAVKGAVTRSRAWSAWHTSQRLADAGVRTPRPVACVENRWGLLRRDSFLAYPYVYGRTLQACLAGEAPVFDDRQFDRLWQRLLRLWQQMRRLRVSLADANVGNFIIDSHEKLWVIDLDKTRFHRLGSSATHHLQLRWQQLLRSASHYQPVLARRLVL
ncbi:MAG: lipopolysaccharide kinase InaA family protein [Pirellulales bacterium]